MRLFYKCSRRQNVSVNEVYVKKMFSAVVQRQSMKGKKMSMLVQVKFCLHEIPFHQAQIFPVMLCFSLYFTCIFIISMKPNIFLDKSFKLPNGFCSNVEFKF